ncbi:hypothetical protein [Polymorphobacter multimanifer]|uniref:hypothetical protein n=1 Tax=Polymorphobacter multimanifer TaxID=1070431 RepID=UPI001667158F|nr:hypothetical protein [Polymorphobacter multimanifer]
MDDADRRGASGRSELIIRLEASSGYDQRVAGGVAGDKKVLMTDCKLWACANRMRNRHGNDALTKASERLNKLCAADDRDGCGVWGEIMTRLVELGPVVVAVEI